MAADTYSNTLGYLQMGTGNDNNAWGTNANSSVFQILEDAIANTLTSTVTGGTYDLSGSPPPAGASQVRHAILVFNGTLTANQIIKVPNLSKVWIVANATTGPYTLTIQTPTPTTPAVIPQDSVYHLALCNAANSIVVSPWGMGGNSQLFQYLAPDCSAAAPAYSNVNEQNSGWYRHGTQDWRLSINGNDCIQVTGAGAGTPNIFNLITPEVFQINGTQYIPAGTVVHYDGITAPAGWIMVYGQALSRPIANGGSVDTYKGIFNAITATVVGNTNGNTSITGLASDMRGQGLNKAFVEGTGIPTGTTITFTGASTATLSAPASGSNTGVTFRILPFGQGDASTTFNVRNGEGTSLFGRDDMNPAGARGFISVAGLNFDGTLLGISRQAADLPGGLQYHTLTTAEMPIHSHANTLSDPGHAHTTNAWFIEGGNGVNAGGNYYSPAVATVNSNTTGITINNANAGSGNSHSIMPPSGISNMIMKL